MKTITIDLIINDNALKLLKDLELLKHIRLHKKGKKHKTDEGDAKEKILTNLTQAFKDAQLFRKGKLKTTPAKDFLNALRGSTLIKRCKN
ncbi:MAG: hypothetical protein NMK33_02965 [Candidatus Cardinium sp.]|uniref:hypothetical protein n=1 Tax=Cardinium endosymbiont of Dermatophagoides farinae TaxID=2597823 RepID=UPI0011836D2D|nr:hypothetical protein [Cardinium endosymbiont of Dermatophagoides farinae]TSJ81430.1 hypothetical protein FPG78_05650 [Cardinium endosymbiont of Dermatophagoides farinae]UWW97492.1 MAG: hypothetical protein NMK33_02965 [Candidatus Cardinium sp.]